MRWNPFRRRRRIGPGGRTTRHPPDGRSPAEAEARIADAPNEWLYVYAPDGTQIGRSEGTPANVDLGTELMRFTDEEPPRSVLRDHLVVHNHPPADLPEAVANFPPSPDDLLLAVERDLREYVVVSGSYRYVVRRPGDDWRGDPELYALEIGDQLRTLEARIGPVGPTLADAVERQHLVLVRLHQNGWIDYGRTTR